jgi:predicted negative regulator of RcsB-dependent stress response
MTAPARPTLEDHGETIFGWVQEHSRQLLIGAVAVAALAGGFALYDRNRASEAQRAEQALSAAERSVYSGNLPLAQSDLRKVVERYKGTPAADRANLLMAQVLYDQGKYAEGIKQLEALTGSKSLGASAEGLTATGYEALGKYKEAADHFGRAAAASTFDVDRANFKASAARAFTSAGDAASAKKIWTELATDPAGPAAGEARVRLGELTVAPASRS